MMTERQKQALEAIAQKHDGKTYDQVTKADLFEALKHARHIAKCIRAEQTSAAPAPAPVAPTSAARMTIYSVTWDSDAGTETHVFTSEEARDHHIKTELAAHWEGPRARTDAMPDDWQDALELLMSRGADWWLHTQTHEIAAFPVTFSPLAGKVA